MPSRKQPKTLRSAAQEQVVNLTLHACVEVEKMTGLDSTARPKIIQEIQECLGKLPESLLNEVCQVILEILPFLYQTGFVLLDKTFAYAVVMHKNLNKVTLGMDHFCYTNETDCFWNDRLRSMSKLSEIRFEFTCPPSYVSTVIDSCPNLKKITLSASMLSSRVTESMSLLTRCSQLRYINCGRVSANCGDLMQHLLESLPDLEVCIVPDDTSLGDILTRMTNNGPMKLKYFSENSATPAHIDSVIALCPYITELKLQPVSVEALDGIMGKLMNSSLKIPTLELIFNFPHIRSRFESFLESKGSYLNRLDIVFMNEWIPSDVVSSIGEFCPHLEILKIQVKTINREFDLPENSTPIVVNSEGTRPFQKLSTLEFHVEPYVFMETPVFNLRIVHYCLENAVHLKSLRCEGVLKPGVTYDEFVTIFGKGRLQELKYLGLFCYTNVLTKEMIRFFYDSFQDLTCVELAHMFPPSVERYMFELMKEVKKNNIDFAIKYAFLPTVLAAHHLHLSE